MIVARSGVLTIYRCALADGPGGPALWACALMHMARLFTLAMVSGWSAPSTRVREASPCRNIGSASARLPWVSRQTARLFTMVMVSGWSAPSTCV